LPKPSKFAIGKKVSKKSQNTYFENEQFDYAMTDDSYCNNF